MDIDSEIAEIRKTILISPTNLCSALDAALIKPPDAIKDAIQVFRESLEGCMKVASLPYSLTYEGVVQQRFNSFDTAERIRQLPHSGDLTSEQILDAYKIACGRMDAFLVSDEGQTEIVRNTVQSLGLLINRLEVRHSLEELLLEAVVMIWGAFEVFVSDALRSLVNLNPRKALVLFNGETKKYLSNRAVTIDALASREFDLTNAMGDLFFDAVRLDSLPTMRDVVFALYSSEGLRSEMNNPDLWTLWQRRNLIAHRRGVVDQMYIQRTGDAVPVGQRISLSGYYIDKSAELVRDCALALIGDIEREGAPNRNLGSRVV